MNPFRAFIPAAPAGGCDVSLEGALQPEAAAASDWGLRVLDFSMERFRHERGWLDALEAAAGRADDGDPDR